VAEGGARPFIRSVRVGECGAIQGASSATSTRIAIPTAPIMKPGWRA